MCVAQPEIPMNSAFDEYRSRFVQLVFVLLKTEWGYARKDATAIVSIDSNRCQLLGAIEVCVPTLRGRFYCPRTDTKFIRLLFFVFLWCCSVAVSFPRIAILCSSIFSLSFLEMNYVGRALASAHFSLADVIPGELVSSHRCAKLIQQFIK